MKVGDRFKDELSIKIEILHIGKEKGFFISENGIENCRALRIIKQWTPLPPEREKIELFECMDSMGTISFRDKSGRHPWMIEKIMGSAETVTRIPNGRTIYLDAETFEIIQDDKDYLKGLYGTSYVK